jgi:signal transduction histidine kinase
VTTVLDEILAYVGFDAADREHLRGLQPKLAPHFPAIAAQFYEAVLANPGTASVLKGPEQIERLRVTLIDWMSSGLLGPYDGAFYERRSRIGRRHVAIGLQQRYMFTSINVVRTAYLDRIATLYSPTEALVVMRSVDKLFDIELALMLRHYQLESEQKLIRREHDIVTDRLTALQTLSAGLAHEVRNPLNAAKLQLEVLERRVKKLTDDPRVLGPTELANQEIDRLSRLLTEFLAFARGSQLDRTSHDVLAIAREIVRLERTDNIKLTLVPAKGELIASIDVSKTHQILQNLVRNAVEATPRGGTVSVELFLEPQALRIRVADTGPGMSDDTRRHIFEPFFTTKESGTGLGMSIVHSYVSMHGGTIDIKTGASGTIVDVVLPAGRE